MPRLVPTAADAESLPNRAVPASVIQMMTRKVRPRDGEDGVEEVPADRPSKRGKSAAEEFASGLETPQPQSQQPADEYTVILIMGKTGLGIEVDWADGKTLFIKGLKAEGAMVDWNRGRSEDVVKKGDRVLAVNGKYGDPKAMLAECRKGGKLQFQCRRGAADPATSSKKGIQGHVENALAMPLSKPGSNEIVVMLELAGKVLLGLEVDWCSGTSLYIKSIHSGGAVDDWNRAHKEAECVYPGDTLVAVNGFANDPQAMIAQVRAQRRLHLLVRGPPPPPKIFRPAAPLPNILQ